MPEQVFVLHAGEAVVILGRAVGEGHAIRFSAVSWEFSLQGLGQDPVWKRREGTQRPGKGSWIYHHQKLVSQDAQPLFAYLQRWESHFLSLHCELENCIIGTSPHF